MHAILAVGCLAAAILFVPRIEKYYKDYNLLLPWPTKIVLGVTHWLYNYWYILPLFLLPVLTLDLAILFQLHRSGRTRRWSYALALAILLLIFLLSACVTLELAMALVNFWL